MTAQLKENDELYRGQVYQKQEIMIDALEDLAAADLGFRDEILAITEKWRKPDPREIGEGAMLAARDREMKIQRLERLRNEQTEAQNEVKKAENDVESMKNEIERLRTGIQDMKQRVFAEADIFSYVRERSDAIVGLQKSFEALFVREEPEQYSDEFETMLKENALLKHTLAQRKCELDIAGQITKRMAIMTGVKFT